MKFLTLAIAMAAMVLGGCDYIGVTPIKEIVAAPANFDGKEVKLRGVVKDTTRIPLVNIKSYVLKDDSGEINIHTEADLPKMNTQISVRARVQNVAIIKGESIGTTLTEIERY